MFFVKLQYEKYIPLSSLAKTLVVIFFFVEGSDNVKVFSVVILNQLCPLSTMLLFQKMVLFPDVFHAEYGAALLNAVHLLFCV